MKIIESVQELRDWRKQVSTEQSVGFVPTMGALHLGHTSLLDFCNDENDVSIISIFVNPTQFNDPSDFEKYPKTWETDLALCEKYGADVIFAPRSREELYPDHYHYRIHENQFSNELCGEFRPGHFDGVLSVVMKLFNLIKPTRAYFGEKDHQQLSLIEGMTKAFFMDVDVIPCPTVRESSGLAMSSRNLRLSPIEKELAPMLYQTMREFRDLDQAKASLTKLGFKVEYLVDKVEPKGTRRYAAAWLGNVRLIDNVKL